MSKSKAPGCKDNCSHYLKHLKKCLVGADMSAQKCESFSYWMPSKIYRCKVCSMQICDHIKDEIEKLESRIKELEGDNDK